MAVDTRFHPGAGPLPLAAILAAAGGQADGDPARRFDGVAPLAEAGPTEVSFCADRRYRAALLATRAGAVILVAEDAAHLPTGATAILVERPALAFIAVARAFHPPAATPAGIHPTASVAADAHIPPDCTISAHAVVGAGAQLGQRCVLHPHAVVGAGVVLGDGCIVHAHASISHAIAGAGVVLHPGARVGQEGFGFVPTAASGYATMPQLGRVVLGDRVEIGANSCVDRGALGDTVVGPGTRLDNLVQIAHNVRMGSGCVVVAMAGISGSATLGDRVMIGGQAALAGHITIGDRVRIGSQAGVINDLAAGAEVIGSPAWPLREFWRSIAELRRLGRRAPLRAG